MIIKNTGKLSEDFYATGSAATPVFLLDGPAPVLFDGGFTAFARHYEQDIKAVLKHRAPAYLFLTHSHFDHVGAVSYFKRIWPNLKIAGSLRCSQILSNPKAVNLIAELNREGTKNIKKMGVKDLYEHPFESFGLDLLLKPGEIIRLPDRSSITAFNTPGHTWDFMSYWVLEKKILIASETVACIESNGYIQTEFLVGFDAYLNSLNLLKGLGAKILCSAHHANFTHEDAIKHIQNSITATHDFSEMAQLFLEQEKNDIKKAVLKVKAVEWDPRPWPKQPEPAYLLNTYQKVKTIWEKMNSN